MTRKRWFRSTGAPCWFVPVSVEGWAILGAFAVAIFSIGLMPAAHAGSIRVGLGIGYLALSYWLAESS